MEIRQRAGSSATIIGLSGRWVCGYDLRTEIRTHVQRVIEAGDLDVVLDLGEVTFADSTVVGEIASTHIALRRRGRRLTLLNPSTRMIRLLSISRLASVIDIQYDRETQGQAGAGPTPIRPGAVDPEPRAQPEPRTVPQTTVV
jgi:anti-anti-sigma factor